MNVVYLILLFYLQCTITLGDMSDIQIAVLIPITGDSGMQNFATGRVLESVNLIDKQLQSNENRLLQNYNISFPVYDSGCDARKGVRAVIDATNEYENSLVAVLGSICSVATQPAALYTSIFEVPQLSYAAADVSLSNKELYPYFSRTGYNGFHEANTRAHILKYFGWSKYCVITESHFQTTDVRLLNELTSEMGIEMTALQNVETADEKTIRKALELLKLSNIRVFVVQLLPDSCQIAVNIAKEMKLFDSGYAWIFNTGCLAGKTEESDPEFYENIKGAITTEAIFMGTGESADIFKHEWNKEMVHHGLSYNIVSLFAYDGLLSLLNALDSTVRAGFKPTNGAEVMKALRRVSFEGASGDVKFNENLDRIGFKWKILNVKENGRTQVGEFTEIDSTVRITSELYWPGNAATVPDAIQKFVIPESFKVALRAVVVFIDIVITGFGIGLELTWDTKIMKASSRQFMALMLFFGFCTISSTLLMVIEPTESDSSICAIQLIAINFPMMGIISCLVLKTWRIAEIFKKNSLRPTIITDKSLLKIVFCFLAFESLILTVWIASRPPQHAIQSSNGVLVSVCLVDWTYFSFNLIVYGLMLLWGAVVSFQTRNVATLFNESKYIGFSVYNFLLLGLIAIPLRWYVHGSSPVLELTIMVVPLIYGVAVAIFPLFVHKFNLILKNKVSILPNSSAFARNKRQQHSSTSTRMVDKNLELA